MHSQLQPGNEEKIAMVTFPFPIVECHGADALKKWAELRKRGQAEGFYPIIVGDEKDLGLLTESWEMNDDDPDAIIARAASMNGADVLEARASSDAEFYENVDRGDWPSRVSPQALVSHTELRTGKPKPEVYLAQLPTLHSHEVLAYLGYGAWNDCPSAEEHVAIQQMWHSEYGAEIIAVTSDVIECVVTEPPSTRPAAISLARQQFVYCADIVYQGTETLSTLAASLKDHNTWYF